MKKIIVLGGGYAGVLAAKNLAKKLKKNEAEIFLIDKNPYHTLLTEIHEIACQRVSNETVKVYYDKIFNNNRVKVIQDKIIKFDNKNKKLYGAGFDYAEANKKNSLKIKVEKNTEYSYDYLVIATGSKPAFFGIPGAKENTLSLWSYDDAIKIQQHILSQFEKAGKELNPEKRKELLTFVICGAGFSGVEMAGELQETINRVYSKKYNIRPKEAKVILLDASPRLLRAFSDKAAAKSAKIIKNLGVELLMDVRASSVHDGEIFYNDNKHSIKAKTIIWTTGIEGGEFICANGNCIIETERGHRGQTDKYLRSQNDKYIYIIGDNTFMIPKNSDMPLPQMVENCELAAPLAAHNIQKSIRNQENKLKEYNPTFHGAIVSIGSRQGVAELKFFGQTFIFGTWIAMFAKNMINLVYLFLIGGYSQSWRVFKSEFFYTDNNRNPFLGLGSNQSPSIYLVPLRIIIGLYLVIMSYQNIQLLFENMNIIAYAFNVGFLIFGGMLIIGLFITPVAIATFGLVLITLIINLFIGEVVNVWQILILMTSTIALVGIGSRGIQPLSVDFILYPYLVKAAKHIPLLKHFYLYND